MPRIWTERIKPRWDRCLVVATGPSLTVEMADLCRAVQRDGWPIVAVNDAYRMLPEANLLYACDAAWWDVHHGALDFRGERWSSHALANNDKRHIALSYGVRLVSGADAEGFSFNPDVIHYGGNSGFQAINLALLLGASRIALVGFDMRTTAQRHFFGHHPAPLLNHVRYEQFIPHFEVAAKRLPADRHIVNCTPGSALTMFPSHALTEFLCPVPA